jgi:hypothetical protein
MICGNMHPVDTTSNFTTNFTTGEYVEIWNPDHQDLQYNLAGQFVMNLSDFFYTNEVTTYRDAFLFLDEISVVCTNLSYYLCVDELCATNYTDVSKVNIQSVLGDGSQQLVIKTDVSFMEEAFYLKVHNKGLEEMIVAFEIMVCGAEVVSNVGLQINTTVVDSTNYG